nr:hypothetical protein [Micromonospora sp. DSM 115978]
MPAPVAYVRDLMLGFDAPWFLCGGWAADAWLGGQTREHWDVDIAVFHRDQRAIFEHLAGWALVGHDPHVADESTEPWNGRRLDLPAHIHVPEAGSTLAAATTGTHTAFEFEFLLNERSGDDWVLTREPLVTIGLDRCARLPGWGVPTAAPEVVLFYKAGGNLTAAEIAARGGPIRPRDQQDFLALLPNLTPTARRWLGEALTAVRPEHPWLPI